jgi:hypothetical protein
MVTAVLVLLMWTVPQTRSDGSPLDNGEIAYYVIYRGDSAWDETTATTYDAQRQGNYCVRAVDSGGNTSACSNTVRVKVKGKRR